MTTLQQIELQCPICETRFRSQTVVSTNSFGGKRTDFHERAAGFTDTVADKLQKASVHYVFGGELAGFIGTPVGNGQSLRIRVLGMGVIVNADGKNADVMPLYFRVEGP